MKTPEELEEEHLPHDRKEWRKARKTARLASKSQIKRQPRDVSGLPLGRVLSVTAQGYEVDYKGDLYLCSLRRTHLQHKRQAKGLVTVGDLVYFEPIRGGEGAIAEIKERYSVLQRSDSLQARRQHLIAANIDQVLITASVGSPPLKPALVDRYIIAAKKGNMTPTIVVNKTDQGNPQELKAFRELYSALGYTVIPVSAETGKGLLTLRKAMKGKASVFAGQSGVGKSSLINALTGLDLPVGKVVSRTRKGAHTTSRSRLIPLPSGGWCIDTPGIKSFGLWSLSRDEVASFFPELEALRPNCHFGTCSHTHEPNCAVIEALEAGEISPMRYDSYLSLLEEAESRPRRR